MRPRTACDTFQSSRNQKNSKKPIIPTVPRKWAMNATTDPKSGKTGSSIGPRKREKRKSTSRITAFSAMGPSEKTAMRTRGLGGSLPSIGNDFTNM